MPEIRGRRKLMFVAILLFVPAVLALLAAELVIRSTKEYVTPETMRRDAPEYAPAVFSRHVFPRRERTIVYGRGDEAKRVPINSLGYRGPKFSVNKPDDTLRILIYGGSAVFDANAPGERDWPQRVQHMLREIGFPRVEVINAGMPGHASSDSLGRFFAEGHLFDPDYVVLYHGWNDIKDFRNDEPLLRARQPYAANADPRMTYANWVDRGLCGLSQLYVRLRMRYYNRKLRVGAEGAMPEGHVGSELSDIALRQFRLNVEMFVDAARNVGAQPILMTQARLAVADSPEEQRARIAYPYVRLTHEGLVAAFAQIDEIVRDISQRKAVPLIDPAEVLSGRDEILYDHVHLTDQGSEELAEHVAQALAHLLTRPVPES